MILDDLLFKQMFERHAAVMLLIDPVELIIVDANFAAADFYGYMREEMRGLPVSRINAQPESEISPQREQAMRGEKNSFVFSHRLADDAIRIVEVQISTISYMGRKLFFSIVHDITERKRAEDLIRKLAFHDALTELPNRHLLHDRLSQAMAASKRNGSYAALMLLDLDSFKSLNDRHGHAFGDKVLVEFSKRLKTCMREIDTLARFGGDEFVVILGQLAEDRNDSFLQVQAVAEKIRARMAEPYVLEMDGGQMQRGMVEYVCTASMGAVVFQGCEIAAESILKWADEAMYRAKMAGGNQVQFHQSEA